MADTAGSALDGTWLITGATGSIGPAIVDAVVADGHGVRIMSRNGPEPGDADRWARAARPVDDQRGDVCDRDSVEQAVSDVDVVIHVAGMAHRRPKSKDDTQQMYAVNRDGSCLVAEAARDAGVRRVVLVSSASVYGRTSTPPRDEQCEPRPDSDYGASKLAAERVMREVLGDRLSILRPSAVYGPRLVGQYGMLAKAATASWPVPIVDGVGHCLVTDRDLAAVIVWAAQFDQSVLMNVSDGSSHTVREIVDAIRASVSPSPRRWSIAPAGLGRFAQRLLSIAGTPDYSRRARLASMSSSLASGPDLNADRLHRSMNAHGFDELQAGWRYALRQSD